MRHYRGSESGNVGPVRRIFRGLFFLVAAPVFIGVGLIMLPFVLVARLLGFRGPVGRFGKHGFGCRGRRGSGQSETLRDAEATA